MVNHKHLPASKTCGFPPRRSAAIPIIAPSKLHDSAKHARNEVTPIPKPPPVPAPEVDEDLDPDDSCVDDGNPSPPLCGFNTRSNTNTQSPEPFTPTIDQCPPLSASQSRQTVVDTGSGAPIPRLQRDIQKRLPSQPSPTPGNAIPDLHSLFQKPKKSGTGAHDINGPSGPGRVITSTRHNGTPTSAQGGIIGGNVVPGDNRNIYNPNPNTSVATQARGVINQAPRASAREERRDAHHRAVAQHKAERLRQSQQAINHHSNSFNSNANSIVGPQHEILHARAGRFRAHLAELSQYYPVHGDDVNRLLMFYGLSDLYQAYYYRLDPQQPVHTSGPTYHPPTIRQSNVPPWVAPNPPSAHSAPYPPRAQMNLAPGPQYSNLPYNPYYQYSQTGWPTGPSGFQLQGSQSNTAPAPFNQLPAGTSGSQPQKVGGKPSHGPPVKPPAKPQVSQSQEVPVVLPPGPNSDPPQVPQVVRLQEPRVESPVPFSPTTLAEIQQYGCEVEDSDAEDPVLDFTFVVSNFIRAYHVGKIDIHHHPAGCYRPDPNVPPEVESPVLMPAAVPDAVAYHGGKTECHHPLMVSDGPDPNVSPEIESPVLTPTASPVAVAHHVGKTELYHHPTGCHRPEPKVSLAIESPVLSPAAGPDATEARSPGVVPKTIYMVRVGEGEFLASAAKSRARRDRLPLSSSVLVQDSPSNEMLGHDPGLSAIARRQCLNLQRNTMNGVQERAQLLVTSTRRRALQTTELAFHELITRLMKENPGSSPVKALALLRDSRPEPNIDESLRETSETRRRMAEFHKAINFDEAHLELHIPESEEDMENQNVGKNARKQGTTKNDSYEEDSERLKSIEERAKAMRQWLWDRPETVIVVVSHGDFMHRMVDWGTKHTVWNHGGVREFTMFEGAEGYGPSMVETV